jgi:hypothetical protein
VEKRDELNGNAFLAVVSNYAAKSQMFFLAVVSNYAAKP